MRKTLTLVVMAGWAATASAAYVNNFSSLDFISTRPPLPPPYLDYGGTAVSVDGPQGQTGYMMTDLKPVVGNNPLDLSLETEITLRWRIDYKGTGTPPSGDELGLWLRVYSGTWDPQSQQWQFGARAGWFMPAKVDEGWFETTKDFKQPEDLYNNIPLDYTKIYAFRFDVVYWDAKYTPNTMSFDHFEIVPEPTTLGLLSLGLLRSLRRR